MSNKKSTLTITLSEGTSPSEVTIWLGLRIDSVPELDGTELPAVSLATVSMLKQVCSMLCDSEEAAAHAFQQVMEEAQVES